MRKCIYLHGFASGPSSTKAQFFSTQLRHLGFEVIVPDLNGESFSNLTITNQLSIVEQCMKAAAGEDVLMLGSSMGGLLSVLAAQRFQQIKALVLLAPGFGLNRRWVEIVGPDKLALWKQEGSINVFHYSVDKELPLNYSFIEDAQRYQTDDLKVDLPTLVFHGVRDAVVPVGESRRFSDANPSYVELHAIDSDHALLDQLEPMWELTVKFLQAHAALLSV